jgi:hypothetical protein
LNKTLDDFRLPIKLGSLYLISFSVLLRFDFLFDGANRFIPFRVITCLMFFWLILSFLPFIKSDKFQKEVFFFIIAFLLYFLIVHFFWLDNIENLASFFRNQFHFLYILAGFFLTRFLAIDLEKHQIYTLVKSVIIGAILVGFIEAVFRFFSPTLDLNSESTEYLLEIYQGAQGGLSLDTFYFFKMSSIMFFDSNYVGAFLLVFLSLNIALPHSPNYLRITFSTLLYFLILLSLSRASILVGTAILAFSIWDSWALKKKWILVLVSSIVVLFVVFIVKDEVAFSDGSFSTKLQILDGLSGFFDQKMEVALIGLGYEIGGYLYSYTSGGYAHIHLAILLGELGLIGTLVYFGYWCMIGVLQGPKILYIFLPFLIVGFSLADPWEISYFWACGLLYKF